MLTILKNQTNLKSSNPSAFFTLIRRQHLISDQKNIFTENSEENWKKSVEMRECMNDVLHIPSNMSKCSVNANEGAADEEEFQRIFKLDIFSNDISFPKT